MRVAGRPRHDVEDANLEHVAGLRVFYRHRAGADVHAEPLARAAAEHRRVHRAGAAPVHVLPIPGPGEHVFGAGVASNHSLRIVGGVLGQGFDGDRIARTDFGLRRQRAAEIAPMYPARLHRQIMVGLIGVVATCITVRDGAKCDNLPDAG